MRKPPPTAPNPFPLRWARGVHKVRTTETITHYGTRDGYTTIRVFYRGFWNIFRRERIFSVPRQKNEQGCYTRSERSRNIMALLKTNLGLVEESSAEVNAAEPEANGHSPTPVTPARDSSPLTVNRA